MFQRIRQERDELIEAFATGSFLDVDSAESSGMSHVKLVAQVRGLDFVLDGEWIDDEAVTEEE